MQNELLRAMDEWKAGILLLLNLSATFDTVCHDILLRQLESDKGMHETALAWLSSYLENRQQPCQHSWGDVWDMLCPAWCAAGVSTWPTGILRVHLTAVQPHPQSWPRPGLPCRRLALFFFVRPVQAQVDGAVDRVQLCVCDICIWMRNHFLKLNDNKTEMLVVGSRKQLSKVHISDVAVGNVVITPSTKVRDLGVVPDTEMTMADHINSVCRSLCHQIRNISLICLFLCQDTCRQVVHASVTSRLDFCNSLLVGLPWSTTGKLQQCQNMAASVINRTRESEHNTTVAGTPLLPVE